MTKLISVHGVAGLDIMIVARYICLACLCTTMRAEAAPVVAGSTSIQYYVMRHLDRIDQPCDALSVRGQEAARRLAAWLANKPLATIATSRFDRAIDTAKPTAALRNVSSSQLDNVPLQIAFAKTAAKPVLVVGNTFSVRRLILGLGGKPPDEDPKSFGRIWIIGSDKQTTLTVLPQEGLPAKGGPCPPGAKLDELQPKINLRK